MSYILQWTSAGNQNIPGKNTITVNDQTTDTSTSLTLTGKGLNNYGQFQQENFLQLLENFASTSEPTNPTVGQLWYRDTDGILYVCVDPNKVSSSAIALSPTSSPVTMKYWVSCSTNALTMASLVASLGYTPANKAGDTFTGPVMLAADPTTAMGAATKQYVDNAVTGISWKIAVQAATTTGLANLSGLQVVDGYQTVAGDRILVKNQTNASFNGIYIAAAGSWQRSVDTGSASELLGAAVYVESGTANGGSGWVQTTPAPITLGTTTISWSQFFGAGTYTGGTGISINGNTVSNTGVVSLVAGTNITITPGTSGSYTISASSNLSTASTAVSLAGGSTGALPYQSASSSTSFLTAGTSNQVLISGLTPSWTNAPTLTGTNFTGIPLTALASGGVASVGVTLGSTTINLGGSTSTLAGLTSVASTSFVGALTGTASSLAGGGAGQVAYQSSANTTAFTSAGSASQVLIGGTTPTFSSSPAISGANFSGVPNSALVNSSLVLGTTSLVLGTTTTTIAGLSSITSNAFVGGTHSGTTATFTGAVTGTHFISTDSPSMQFGGSAGAGHYADATNSAIRLTNTTGSLYFQTLNGASTMAILSATGNLQVTNNISANAFAGNLATGNGATGTWGINITGTSAATTAASYINYASGYTFTSQTASPATTYTNTTGRLLFVYCYVDVNNSTALGAYINGVFIQIAGISGGNTGYFPITLAVPPGATWRISATNAHTAYLIY